MTDKLNLAKLDTLGVRAHVKGRSAASDTVDGVSLDLFPSTPWDGYADAQIDDYRIDRCNTFRWNANVRMTLRARFTSAGEPFEGTAGFGFWNAPIGIGERSMLSLPAATWFFFTGPNSNIAAAKGVPGRGWKAATIDCRNRLFLALLPAAPLALPLMRLRTAYNRLWPIAQRAMRVDEKMLDDAMGDWREYVLEWTSEHVLFIIDGQVVHKCAKPPRGPLGFVAWIDNQYMVATPQGRFEQGVVPVQAQRSLQIGEMSLIRLDD